MIAPSVHVLDIPLSDIVVPEGRVRDLDPVWAEAMSGLIAAQGLLQPIIVRQIGEGTYHLVVGLHRLEGARLLGHETITARLSEAVTDDAARLEEVMENLGRYDLIALDRCHHLYELRQIWLKDHPDFVNGGGKQGGGHSMPTASAAPEVFGFAADVAERVGLAKRTINHAVSIWSGLAPASRRRLRGTSLATKLTELKALSEQQQEVQAKVLDLILGADHPLIENVGTALAFLQHGVDHSSIEKQFRSVDKAFSRLSDAAVDMVTANHADRIIASLKRLGRI